MNWIKTLFKLKNKLSAISKFDLDKTSVLILSSPEIDVQNTKDFALLLKDNNVFVLQDFNDWEKKILMILNKIEDNALNIISFGKNLTLGLNIVGLLEKEKFASKLIVLNGTIDLELDFSSDKQMVSVKDDSLNNEVLIALEKNKINSPIYVFKAIGGVTVINENYEEYTTKDVFEFPLNGHHFEMLKTEHINDVAFFVSNIIKERHNLLSFTLTTQSATPNWYIDVEGRPMGEGKAPEHCKKDVAFEMKKCPYSGARKNHENLMNISALKQMRNSWEDSLNLIRFIRDLYLENNPKSKLELVDVWKITMYASYLPTFMLYREEQRFLNHCVPASVASVYKMFIGLKSPIEKMIQEAFLGETKFENLTPEVIHDYAEKNGSFVGPDEVCGGPENLVIEFLNAFMNIETPTKENNLFDAILPNKPGFNQFISSIINIQIIQNIHFQQTQYLVKKYLSIINDKSLSGELKEAFYIDENSIELEKHVTIVNQLQGRIERKRDYAFISIEEKTLGTDSDIEKQNEEVNQIFLKNLRKNELLLLGSLDRKNNVILNESIYEQYMGLIPFSNYYKNK